MIICLTLEEEYDWISLLLWCGIALRQALNSSLQQVALNDANALLERQTTLQSNVSHSSDNQQLPNHGNKAKIAIPLSP